MTVNNGYRLRIMLKDNDGLIMAANSGMCLVVVVNSGSLRLLIERGCQQSWLISLLKGLPVILKRGDTVV